MTGTRLILFPERAAKIVLDTSSFLELEPPATPAGLPLSINGLLTTFTEGNSIPEIWEKQNS